MKWLLSIFLFMHFGQSFAQSAFYYKHAKLYSNAPYDIVETETGFFIVGISDHPGAFADGFMLFIDKQGNVIWDKLVLTEKWEDYRAVIESNNYFYVAGYRSVNNKYRNLIMKVDFDGNIIWDKLFGDTLILGGDNFVQDIILNEQGFLIASSGFDTISMTTNGELIQLDFEGNQLWEKSFGTDDYEVRVDQLKRIELLADGYLLILMVQNQFWQSFPHIIKIDKSGNELWRKNLRFYQSTTTSNDTLLYFKDAIPDSNGNIICYFSRENISTYRSNHVFIKFDENGNELSYFQSPETYGVAWIDLSINSLNEIFVIGQQDLDTVGEYYMQLFASKFDKEFNLIWEHHYGDTANNEIQFSGIPTNDGGVIIGGRNLVLPYPGASQVFNSLIVKTDCNGLLEWNYESCISPETENVLIFPNPFSSSFNIHLPNIPKENEIKIYIYNMAGQKVGNFQFFDSNTIQIDGTTFANGIYGLKIYLNDEEYYTGKVVKVG